jgi:hypothetical protein
VLWGVLGSRIVGMVLMAGHEKRIHGQPLCLREFATHAMLDFQSNQFRHLKKVLACEMGDIRIAKDLFHKGLWILRHLGSPDTPCNPCDLLLRITVFSQEGSGDLYAFLLVAFDRFHITRIVEPCRKNHSFEVFRAEAAGSAYGFARLGYGFGMLEIVILHPFRLGCFEKSLDAGTGFMDECSLEHALSYKRGSRENGDDPLLSSFEQ